MERVIKFFATNTLFANIIFVSFFILATFSWINIGKEEMPSFESDWVRVTTPYPGATSEDVESLVTKPLEDELKSLQGIFKVRSTSSQGVSAIYITLASDYPNKKEVVQNIKDALSQATLPDDVDKPKIRQFKSSEKAIIDIGFYDDESEILTNGKRRELQEQVLSFENQLLSLNEISSIAKKGHILPELRVTIDPLKLKRFNISINEVINQIRANHYRWPLGEIRDKGESKVIVLHELDDKKSLEELVIRRNYQGKMITLKNLASISETYKKRTSVTKVQGYEAIVLSIRKGVSSDILKSREKVNAIVNLYKKMNKNSSIKIKLMDDESFDVSNRLSLISNNGLLGFSFILLILFFALDFKTGLWVAFGIPFSLAVAITFCYFIGYSINNVTLAAVIILMGVVVDDAIIVAENMGRHIENGGDPLDAAVKGSHEVFRPIFASILTTCVAFIPLFYFQGFFGKIVSYIPMVIIFMLFGSLLESYLILPNHLITKPRIFSKFFKNKKKVKKSVFFSLEKKYALFLEKILPWKWFVILFFIGLLAVSGYLFKTSLKFVMFPREETKEIFIRAVTKRGMKRLETAKFVKSLESIFLEDKTKSVVAVRSRIGVSRRGGKVSENNAFLRVELLPLGQRKIKLRSLLKKWKKKTKDLKGFVTIKFIKSRWGRSSGSPIELLIQENNDLKRKKISESIKKEMEKIESISNVEVEKPFMKKEYSFEIDQKEMIRLKVNPSQFTFLLKTFVGGAILHNVRKEEEVIDVKVTVPENFKKDIKNVLKLKISNTQGRLVPVKKILKIVKKNKPLSIKRVNFKRTTDVYADLKKGSKKTPLEVADYFEKNIFPKIKKMYPSAILSFVGEIADSKDSKSDFLTSIVLVAIMTYFILVILFNSLILPFVIVGIIPFGMAGIVFVLLLHKMPIYGFFSIIGTLGMMGVVINDAIVMISKLESIYKSEGDIPIKLIAQGASTRLRAIIITTVTTVVAILPTAYGFFGYDSMLAEMMLTMGWGLACATLITLFLVPSFYTIYSIYRRLLNQWLS
ncbi:efflux RND transporter permease subunit [Bacteriovoracales bacterium]|nr:efflux RND transporter permease subunit [Bacteriovoracales bacterium]